MLFSIVDVRTGAGKNGNRPTIQLSKESISPDAEFDGESFGNKFNTF